jgi:Protein of unknown function (DUF2934)
MGMALTVRELAYRRSQIRQRAHEGALGGLDDDWAGAEFLMHQLVEEAAYYRWLDRVRARLAGDADTDWLAAEAEICYGQHDGHRHGMPGDVDRRLRRQVIREKAYFRWLGRGLWGDPLPDWLAAEREILGHA